MLIIDNRKFIFRKKMIITICSLLAAIFLGLSLKYLITTEKVDQNIPTVYDFETALKERGFEIETADYRLYGITSNEEKAISLSFEENKNDKYPLYVYAEIDFSWLIYYVNGELYAVYGKYWDYYTAYNRQDGYNEEKIIWEYPEKIISETDEISVYNVKTNRYEKGDTIAASDFNYYSKNQDLENSVFIDIPSIESWGTKVTKKDKIHKNSLN